MNPSRSSSYRDRPGLRPLPALLLVLLASLALTSTAAAQPPLGTTDTPLPWSDFCADDQTCGEAYQFDGGPLIDYENSDGYSDPTTGGATPNGAQDIASGFTGTILSPNPCNPVVNNQENCGEEPSAFFAYCEDCQGTRDFIFLRMRVNGDPRKKAGFVSGHWNFLHDVDNDGYKEYWMDVNGGHAADVDRLRLLFEDEDDQEITNENPARGSGVTSCPDGVAGGTLINEYIACWDSSADPVCQNSFTRAVEVTDGTGEWFVDMQLPLDAFTVSDGCGPSSDNTFQAGTSNDVRAAQGLRYLFSTSNSNTDPLQKDRTAPGFGDLAPVTLAHVEVTEGAEGTVLRWTTLTETANVGFDVYGVVDGERILLTREPVASPVGDSVHPQHYRFEIPPGIAAERFFLQDVDIRGRTELHGPFRAGGEYGTRFRPRRVGWAEVRDRLGEGSGAEARGAGIWSRGAPAASTSSAELWVEEDGLYRVTYEDLAAAGVDLSGVRASSLALTNRGRPVPIRIETGASATFGPGSHLDFYGTGADSLYTRVDVYRLEADPLSVRRIRDEEALPDPAPEPTVYEEELLRDEAVRYTFGPPEGAGPWYWDRLLAYDTKPLSRSYTVSVDLAAFVPVDAAIFQNGFEEGNLAAWSTGPPGSLEGGTTSAASPVNTSSAVESTGGGATYEPLGPATLTVELWGVTDFPGGPDHHVEISLNGTGIADERFDGRILHRLEVPVPDGLLRPGDNTLTLDLPGDTGNRFDLVHLDTVGLRYERRAVAVDGTLEVSTSGGPVTVSGLPRDEPIVAYGFGGSRPAHLPAARLGEAVTVDPGDGSSRVVVATPSALRTPAAILPARRPDPVDADAGEYLIVTHESLREALGPLVEARRSQGYSVQVVEVEDLYLTYTHGIVDPEAIRSHIRYAAENLGTKMVLLAGGDTYDYLDHLAIGSVSHVPTLYTGLHPLVTHSPADPLLADLDGDRLPDLPIGRLPARTPEELAAMIDKTLAFETAANGGTAVFAADEATPSFDFADESRILIESFLGGWSVQEAYLDDMPTQEAHDLLLSSLSEGVALAHFFGHSAPGLWTYDGLLDADQARSLTNSDPSLVLQWGCWNTYFVDPVSDSMGSAFLQAPGGAAATFGATTVTELPSDRALAGPLLERLSTPGIPLGVALTEAKRELAQVHPEYEDVLLGWVLLGDPALVLTR